MKMPTRTPAARTERWTVYMVLLGLVFWLSGAAVWIAEGRLWRTTAWLSEQASELGILVPRFLLPELEERVSGAPALEKVTGLQREWYFPETANLLLEPTPPPGRWWHEETGAHRAAADRARFDAWYGLLGQNVETVLAHLSTELPPDTSDAERQEAAQFRGQLAGAWSNLEVQADLVRDGFARSTDSLASEISYCEFDELLKRLVDRVSADPEDAREALLAAFRCTAAVRGMHSQPVHDALSDSRQACEHARDTYPNHDYEADVAVFVTCIEHRGALNLAESVSGPILEVIYSDGNAEWAVREMELLRQSLR